MDGLGKTEDGPTTTGFVNQPTHGSDGRDRSGDQFHHEQISQSRWRNQQEGKLDDPEDEIADHVLCGS